VTVPTRTFAALGWAIPLMLSPVAAQEVPANVQADNATPVEPAPVPATPPAPEIANEEAQEPAPVRQRAAESDDRPANESPADRSAGGNVAEPDVEQPAPAPPTATPAPSSMESLEPLLDNAAAPAATPPAATTSDPVAEPDRTSWLWALLALGALAAVFAGSRLLRRRASVRPVPAVIPMTGGAAAPKPDPQPVAMAAVAAPVEVAFRPVRAGLNLLSATAEGVFVLTNRGDRPVSDIRFGALLLPGHAALDAELDELWAGGVTRPIVAPFALAPGEERELRHTLSLPRGAIEPLMAGGRPMFVPVVAISAVYGRDDGEGQTGRAWVLGVARTGAAKLAPLWLDEPARNRDDVAARPHTATLDR